jgi:hypothetical protein
MTNLDSIKLIAPIHNLSILKNNCFTEDIKKKQDDVFVNKLILDNKDVFGLKGLSVDKLNNNFTIELSAKTLKQDYYRSININTIEQLLDNINKQSIFNISKDFINDAEILKMDVTDNIRPLNYNEAQKKGFYQTLATIPTAQKCNIDLWTKKNNLGIVYKGNQLTVRDRIIVYDKTIELSKDTKFSKEVNMAKLLNNFKGVARVESNHSQFRFIKKHYETRSLLGVLSADVKLNYKIFDRVTSKSNILELKFQQDFETMKWKQIRNFIGDKGIIEMHNYDWQKIEIFINRYNQGNYRRDKKDLLKVYNKLTSNEGQTQTIIEDIKNQLKSA